MDVTNYIKQTVQSRYGKPIEIYRRGRGQVNLLFESGDAQTYLITNANDLKNIVATLEKMEQAETQEREEAFRSHFIYAIRMANGAWVSTDLTTTIKAFVKRLDVDLYRLQVVQDGKSFIEGDVCLERLPETLWSASGLEERPAILDWRVEGEKS